MHRFLKKLKIELPYDPAIPLLGIYLNKTIIREGTRTSVFIAALFTIVKTWKHPECPLTDEWMKKTWYLHTMQCYLVIPKTKAICSNMDGLRDYHTPAARCQFVLH